MLAVFLAGCAANQSAFPIPPVFSPAEDAPYNVGHPGFVGEPEKVPRGTDRRVLPPTREPGIWASDGDLAKVIPTPVMLGFNVPVPVEDGKPDYLLANACAKKIDEMFQEPALKAPTKQLSDEERECLVAQFYEMCVGTMNKGYRMNEQSLLDQGFPRAGLELLKRSGSATADVAKGYRSEKCHEKTNTPAVKLVFKEVLRRW